MSDHTADYPEPQHGPSEKEAVRTLLDQLLADSRLYTKSQDYKDLLDFVVRLRNFAPFNAMLLQVQKPGLSYAASAHDWNERFGRWPKEGARPLLILWPFGPVALVYDVMDTEGKPLPHDVNSFFAQGEVDELKLKSFETLLAKRRIEFYLVDAGDCNAGLIRLVQRASTPKEFSHYRIHINRNHNPATRFVTLTHELAHLFLGHLGQDQKLKIHGRKIDHSKRELEAESVAYLVCNRNGVKSKSETYLRNFVENHTTLEEIEVHQIMRAAERIEEILCLKAHIQFDNPVKPERRLPKKPKPLWLW
ncbi:MAG TPA: ImmA/IrrE family metallo-endopeptidase [Woeseiaceae bacterium]|nr:ImmA/IrrE family metallo-endopeptidase [Woeseiaceae bacterium]